MNLPTIHGGRNRGFINLATLWLVVCCIVGGTLLFKGLAAGASNTDRASRGTANVSHSVHYHTRNIEDLKVGDLVYSRDQNDAAAPIQAKRIDKVFRRTSDHLRILRIQSPGDATEELKTTDTHPFWVQGSGWVNAGDLRAGQLLTQPDGTVASIVSTVREEHPEGVTVYNFRVEEDHTYFASAASGGGPPIWVHNAEYVEPLTTNSGSRSAAFNEAKASNGVPTSQQPAQVIKPGTPEGYKAGLDATRNGRLYEFTNSQGQRIWIREDFPAEYGSPDGTGDQGPHFNSGPAGSQSLHNHHYWPANH